jgi:hypothetical protein
VCTGSGVMCRARSAGRTSRKSLCAGLLFTRHQHAKSMDSTYTLLCPSLPFPLKHIQKITIKACSDVVDPIHMGYLHQKPCRWRQLSWLRKMCASCPSSQRL